ncbi:MAG: DUF3568 family protein [Tepidisphaeraceae bacterium]
MQRLGRAILVLVAASAGGCAAIPVAALGVAGNVSDIGSTAFSVGTEVFSSGKLESVEFATFEQTEQAVRWMLNDLRLRVKELESDKTTAFYKIEDDSESEVKITVTRRTAAICGVRVDVGWFGSEAYARLLLKSIRGRLPSVRGGAATQPAAPMNLSHPALPAGFQTDNIEH